MRPGEGLAFYALEFARRGTALEKAGWNNSSIDPRSLRQLSKIISVHNGQNFGWRRKFCPPTGAPRSRRWPVDEARPGGQEKSVAMSWFYMAMQREPVVMWSCFIGALGTHPRAFPSSQRRCPYAVQSARGFSPRSRRPREVPAARIPRRTARPSRHERVVCSCFCRLTQFLCFPPRQASRCPWWSPPSASPSGARKPCLHPTRTRSPRRSEEATDARAGWRRDGHGVDSSRIVVSTQRA